MKQPSVNERLALYIANNWFFVLKFFYVFLKLNYSIFNNGFSLINVTLSFFPQCSNLMLIESVPGEPLSFHVIPFDNPRLQYTLQVIVNCIL